MNRQTRIGLAGAALALLLLYVVPIWRIDLEAPQYPEGIGMLIRINTVEGIKTHDLDNINNLNHYIGMKRIVPETIPELRLMPWIIGALIVLGLGAVALGKRWALYAWTLLFLAVALFGMWDFWSWEYDYGHNLDPTAIIKVPGMHYQPPLIGSRKLLNFTAHSWPALGGWVAFLSLGVGLVLSVLTFRNARQKRVAG